LCVYVVCVCRRPDTPKTKSDKIVMTKATTTPAVSVVECPECGGGVRTPADAIDGEIVTCRDCGGAFEVSISQSGALSLKRAEAVAEDWGE
jgi:alpha-aminoadipate carrier protein LysW